MNRIFDLEPGGTGYAIEFLLRSVVTRNIFIRECQIETPWGRLSKRSLLAASKKSSHTYGNYVFPGGEYYDGEYVVNQCFARSKSLLGPGEQIEGVLLATDDVPVPEKYPDRARVPVKLCIIDTRGNIFAARFQLPLDRSALLGRKQRQESRRRLELMKLPVAGRAIN